MLTDTFAFKYPKHIEVHKYIVFYSYDVTPLKN